MMDRGYRIYVDILTRGKFVVILVLIWIEFIGQFVHPVRGDGLKRVDGGKWISFIGQFFHPVGGEGMV